MAVWPPPLRKNCTLKKDVQTLGVEMWHTMPDSFPGDNVTVWCRRGWWDTPFEAAFSVSGQIFTTAAGYTLPWWAVWRWRSE